MNHKVDKQHLMEAHKVLQNAQRVLIVAHQKPDGDAIGASLGLWHWLNENNKETEIYCRNDVPDQFLFLPGADKIKSNSDLFKQQWDVVIVCDSGDLKYAGIHEHVADLHEDTVLINIDHHASNQNFGHYNLVNSKASSTAEVVFNFFREIEYEINKEIAKCLLTGVFTDTGGFSNAATNERALYMAAEFSAKGASLSDVYRATVSNKNLEVMKLWGKVLSRLRQNEFGIAHTYVLKTDLYEGGLNEEAVAGLSNYLSHLKDAKAVFVIFERDDGQIKVSMRTFRDDIDLSKLALAVGGGGHKKASGFTVPGRLEMVGDEVRVVPA